jgi:hypothetical protein
MFRAGLYARVSANYQQIFNARSGVLSPYGPQVGIYVSMSSDKSRCVVSSSLSLARSEGPPFIFRTA